MFRIENGILLGYTGTETKIFIPDGVTTVGKGAFEWNEDITSVFIPDSVTIIEDDAFFACSKLEHIRLSGELEKIGSFAFSKCENLKEITLPDSIKTIGASAFEWCGFEEIKIPDSVEKLSDNILRKCRNLKSVSIGKNCSSIGSDAFASTAVEEFNMPDSVKILGSGSFKNCSALKKVKLSDNLREIPDNAFNCTALGGVNLPDSIEIIGKNAFRRCRLRQICLGENVELIGDGAFNLNDNLHVQFSAAPKKVGISAFPAATTQKGVKEMYSTSFCGKINKADLNEISVPESVTTFIPENFSHIVNSEKYNIRLFIGSGCFDGNTPLISNSEIDFELYDSLFKLAEDNEKPMIALLRLAYGINLSDKMQNIYKEILLDNIEAASLFAIVRNDSAALKYILSVGNLTPDFCDTLYDKAHELRYYELLKILTSHITTADPFNIFSF